MIIKHTKRREKVVNVVEIEIEIDIIVHYIKVKVDKANDVRKDVVVTKLEIDKIDTEKILEEHQNVNEGQKEVNNLILLNVIMKQQPIEKVN